MRSAAVSLGLIGGISALGIPLNQQLEQQPLSSAQKTLVSSDGLQDQIHARNLLDRAKILYSIAERGIEEYNHPTRVIGSKGTSESSVSTGCNS